MKKSKFSISTLMYWGEVFIFLFLFSSCENFFSGAKLRAEIESTVAYANAPSYTISVEQPKSRGIIKSPTGGAVSKKVGDVFIVNFEPIIDWEFIRWKIVDSTTKNEIPNGEYLLLSSVDDSETECTFVKAPSDGMKLCLEPVLSERPQIISYTPLYISEGTHKDTTIQVIFDYDMDAESIYYTEGEKDELLASGIAENDFLKTDVGGKTRFYGYKKDGEHFFKNISITDNETGVNRNNCFSAPVFENPRRLSITVRRDTDSEDYIEIPDWSQILVSLENGFFHMVDGKLVTMTSGKKWIYQVTDGTDTNRPVIYESDEFSVKLANGNVLTPILEDSNNPESVPKNAAKKLDINLKIKDIESGPADSFTLKFQRVGSADLPLTKIVRFKSVDGNIATFSDSLSISDVDFETGVYSMSFIFKDMSGNTLEYPSDKRYYFSVNVPFKFLMPIEDIFTMTGRGTVATGKVEMGEINLGDAVQIVGFDKVFNTIITGIEKNRTTVDSAMAGDSVGLLLRGIEKSDLQRGMCLSLPNALQNHKKFEADIYLRKKEEGGRNTPIISGYNYRPNFYFYTTDVLGQMSFVGGMILPGNDATITVELANGMPIYEEQTFLIRDGGRTIGEGTIKSLLD